MKKILLFFVTIFAMFTTTAITQADSNQLQITGYVTNTDVENKTMTISNGNKKEFVIDKVPTKYLAYDKNNGNLTVTATSVDDKLIFNKLQSENIEENNANEDDESDDVSDNEALTIKIISALLLLIPLSASAFALLSDFLSD